MNSLKTTFLMVLLTVLLVLAGNAIGGQQGLMVAFILALVMNFGTYWFSDKIVLAMYRAQEVSREQAPELYDIVESLAKKAGLPMPRVYITPQESPNAFATGRNPKHAAVAVTSGILRMLDRDELAGVLAHELSHIKHRDILISTIAAVMAGAITMLASMARWALLFGGLGGDDRDRRGGGGNALAALAMMILAPIAAMLIQMAISRSREYMADDEGAKISGHPLWLADALRKLQRGTRMIPLEANPSTAHMFIVNPLRGVGIQNLFSTHPPIEERIARLERMAR
ncbi:MAG: zinc metalloprotease HtpX [bacterium]|nr:zinc metalloprotease HtpX [bacterium]